MKVAERKLPVLHDRDRLVLEHADLDPELAWPIVQRAVVALRAGVGADAIISDYLGPNPHDAIVEEAWRITGHRRETKGGQPPESAMLLAGQRLPDAAKATSAWMRRWCAIASLAMQHGPNAANKNKGVPQHGRSVDA